MVTSMIRPSSSSFATPETGERLYSHNLRLIQLGHAYAAVNKEHKKCKARVEITRDNSNPTIDYLINAKR